MLSTLIVACTYYLSGNIGHGQILRSGGILSSAHDLILNVTIDLDISIAAFEMQGPSDVWFGVGWDSTTMAGTYGMVVLSDSVVERSLSYYSGGTVLTSTITIYNDTTDGDIRKIIFYRNASALDSNYYDFSEVTSTTEIDIIWAVGSSSSFSQHNSTNRGTRCMQYMSC